MKVYDDIIRHAKASAILIFYANAGSLLGAMRYLRSDNNKMKIPLSHQSRRGMWWSGSGIRPITRSLHPRSYCTRRTP